ncbi:hypothetical protein L9F63_004316, partial [Diploptera punctata]
YYRPYGLRRCPPTKGREGSMQTSFIVNMRVDTFTQDTARQLLTPYHMTPPLDTSETRVGNNLGIIYHFSEIHFFRYSMFTYVLTSIPRSHFEKGSTRL